LYIHLALEGFKTTGLLRPALGYTLDYQPVVHRPEYIEKNCRLTRQG
jgi:hypothetical protein